MTQRTSNCPNCGAPIVFRWSSSVQTVCGYCKSILVRTDVDLKKVGQVADLPPDATPIQITSEGKYGNRAFVVLGRIIYEYDQGNWNEWHILFNDGADGWLHRMNTPSLFAKRFRGFPLRPRQNWEETSNGMAFSLP